VIELTQHDDGPDVVEQGAEERFERARARGQRKHVASNAASLRLIPDDRRRALREGARLHVDDRPECDGRDDVPQAVVTDDEERLLEALDVLARAVVRAVGPSQHGRDEHRVLRDLSRQRRHRLVRVAQAVQELRHERRHARNERFARRLHGRGQVAQQHVRRGGVRGRFLGCRVQQPARERDVDVDARLPLRDDLERRRFGRPMPGRAVLVRRRVGVAAQPVEPFAGHRVSRPGAHRPQRNASGFTARASSRSPERVAGCRASSGCRTASLRMTPPSFIATFVARRPHCRFS
jgi:hypothetical protein